MYPTRRDFQSMAERTGTGILIHEAASKNILWANPAACRMFGFTLDELRPLKAHHMSSQERQYRRTVGVAWLQSAVIHGSSRRQWKYRTKAGDDFLTDANASFMQFQDGPVVMVEFRNISEEVEIAQELSWVSHSLQRIMTYTSAGILVLDENNRIEDVSRFAARLFDSTPEVLVGVPVEDLGRCDPPLNSEDVVAKLAERTGSVKITLKIKRTSASITWLAGELEDVLHDGMTSRLLVLRDVTDRVELEMRHEYQEANVQYLSRYNAMGDMAMILAHELGQPLAATSNYLSGLKSRVAGQTLDREQLSYGLDMAERQLSRAAEIVASVKRYVRRIESAMSVVDLTEVVDESLYFVRLRADDLGVSVNVEQTDEPLPVDCESVLIGQVVINLCFNAIDEIVLTTTRVKELTVKTSRDGGSAYVRVMDEGRGMESAPENRLAAGAFSEKQDGSGLGLILSEHIVERHGGEIEFLPNEPRGTEARLRLPVSESGRSHEKSQHIEKQPGTQFGL